MYLAVACDISGSVPFCAVLFPRDVLHEIWDSVPEGFYYLLSDTVEVDIIFIMTYFEIKVNLLSAWVL